MRELRNEPSTRHAHSSLGRLGRRPALAQARAYLLDEDNAFFFSAATIWEIGIKHAKHPEIMGISSAEARELFLELGYQELPIRADHGIAAESLPFLHNDPFDRILIAQAKAESLRLLSHDRMLAQYGDPVLAV